MANNDLIITQRSDIVAIADKVRSHTGQTKQLTLGEIASGVDVVASMGGGGEQATPVISVNSANGLITATAGDKSSTYQLTTQAAKTITPTKSSQTAVTSGKYTTGNITVGAIPSDYIDTLDAAAIADEISIMTGASDSALPDDMINNLKSANAEVDNQAEKIAQIIAALDEKLSNGASIQTTTVKPTSRVRNISFTGLTEEPKMFSVVPVSNTTLNSSYRYAMNISYDGTNTVGVYSTTSTATYTSTGFTFTYSNGTLTINTTSTSNGGYFASGVTYQLTYVGGKVTKPGVEVRKASGTFTTNTSGVATVNCGFQPDMVYVQGDTEDEQTGELYDYSMAMAFNEDTRSNVKNTTMQASDGMITGDWTRNSTGFSVTVLAFDWDYSATPASQKSFSYVAVKYT